MDFKSIEPKILERFTADQYLIKPAIQKGVCQRCAGTEKGEVNGKLYCRQCVNFGRLDQQSKIILFGCLKIGCQQNSCLCWRGKLSPLQKKISDELSDDFLFKQELLLWAVTGAGKTEILFATIDKALQNGLRIALVSPRVDVCEELYPRFKKAFTVDIALMHGKKADELEWIQFVIATVHQLIKFHEAFDLVIVDEVDSYPLFGNLWLQEILYRSMTKNSHVIYLSATPPQEIKKRVDKIYYLPQRFHGKPLPVPKQTVLLKHKVLPKRVLRHIQKLIENNQRFLMFFPSIEILKEFNDALIKERIVFDYAQVSSRECERLDIVQKFRDNQLFALFTTTILERGVTFNNIDVIVFQAEHRNFSKEILIQIAGRAGRQVEHFDNEVTFYYFEYHRQIKMAVAEIKKLNRLAENLK